MESVTNYTINNVQQLIDLNKDSTNFKLNFHIKSTNPTDKFQILVANQTELDQQKELDFQNVEHEIGGDVVADKNVYQNYYLILRAEHNVDVQVTILFEPLPDFIETVEPSKEIPVENEQSLSTETNKNEWTRRLLVGILLISFCFVLYSIFRNLNKQKSLPISLPDDNN